MGSNYHPPENMNESGIVGEPGTQEFVFKALKAGKQI